MPEVSVSRVCDQLLTGLSSTHKWVYQLARDHVIHLMWQREQTRDDYKLFCAIESQLWAADDLARSKWPSFL